MDEELEKIDEQGAIKWLKPGELGIIPPKTRIITLTFSFNHKRQSDGTIEERKSHASLRGDRILPGIHFGPKCTSAPMARMVVSYSVDKGWTLEHIDMKSAFLYGEYKYSKPVIIREAARSDGTYKYGNTVGVLMRNLFGNPSVTYYYVQGLLKHFRKIKDQLNEAEDCPVRVEMPAGAVIAAIAVEDLLVATETSEALEHFAAALKTKYNIKRLGRPHRYLGWHFHY